MAKLSNYLENLVINNLLGQEPLVLIGNLYFALFTSAPSDAGGGTEVAGGGSGYARVNVANVPDNFPTATTGEKRNAVDILWGPAASAWGTITHVGVFDASSGGNLLFYGDLNVTVNTSDVLKIGAGNLVIQIL